MTTAPGPDGKPVTEAGPYVFTTWAQAAATRDALGAGMLALGMLEANSSGHKIVGLFSKNRMEWELAAQALHAYGGVDCALYDTLGPEAIAFILGQTEMPAVFCDAPSVAKLLEAKRGGAAPKLRAVVQFEDLPAVAGPGARADAAAAGVTLHTYAEVIAAGKAAPAPHAPPAPGDLGFLCYTSGTTGMPKGAMILHRNMVAMASSALTARLGLTEVDVHISYLPLAHIMERLISTAVTMTGGCIGYYQGDTTKLIDDLKALRPTIFPSVPRLWNRIYDRITAGAAAGGFVKAALFNAALASKKGWLASDGIVTHSVWDALVFKPVAGRVGLDRCRIMITGSAPIAPHVLEFLRVGFACTVVEGYGQTECSAAATLTNVDQQALLGHVGGPLACCDVKLVSVPDMGYRVSDTVHGEERDASGGVVLNPGLPCRGRGEVCYRGHNVFAGYYRDAEKTAEVLEADGWLHSGDVGLWDERGNLRIIDRKKNIFKLSQGEYVAAEKIENIAIKSPLVAQAFVYGDSLRSMLVAIVTPKEDGAAAWARAAGLPPPPPGPAGAAALAALAARPDFTAAVLASVTAECKAARLQGFEIPKAVHVDAAAWTPEDVLTPTMKLKRAEAKKRYGPQIDAMYAALGDLVAGVGSVKQGAVSLRESGRASK